MPDPREVPSGVAPTPSPRPLGPVGSVLPVKPAPQSERAEEEEEEDKKKKVEEDKKKEMEDKKTPSLWEEWLREAFRLLADVAVVGGQITKAYTWDLGKKWIETGSLIKAFGQTTKELDNKLLHLQDVPKDWRDFKQDTKEWWQGTKLNQWLTGKPSGSVPFEDAKTPIPTPEAQAQPVSPKVEPVAQVVQLDQQPAASPVISAQAERFSVTTASLQKFNESGRNVASNPKTHEPVEPRLVAYNSGPRLSLVQLAGPATPAPTATPAAPTPVVTPLHEATRPSRP